MSKVRHPEPEILVRSWMHRVFNGSRLQFYDRTWVQLIYAVEGVVTVSTPEGVWVIPPHRAVWVPPGIPREGKMSGTVSLRTLYFRPEHVRLDRAKAVSVTPLAREMIRHVAESAPLKTADAKHRRLVRVLLDLLTDLSTLPVYLPPPSSPEAIRAAGLLSDGMASIDVAARASGLSKRTLERRFRDETGLSVGAWTHQARLIEAMRRLAANEPVADVAFSVGYQSSSAFIAAFKAAFGVTPGAMYPVP